jgi:hypothetical protein
MASRRAKAPKVSAEAIKRAAARAEARSEGKDLEETKAEITPPIVPAAEIAAKKKTTAKRRKRRTLYSIPLGKALCKMLSRGHTLTSICKRPGMPREDAVLGWASNPAHPFSNQYVRAREVGYLRMADQLVDIADNSVNDYMETVDKDGSVRLVPRKESLERTRIRIDTRKWLLSKALPKIYGDRVAMEHTGKDGGPIETAQIPQATGEDHLAEVAARFAGSAAKGKPANKMH